MLKRARTDLFGTFWSYSFQELHDVFLLNDVITGSGFAIKSYWLRVSNALERSIDTPSPRHHYWFFGISLVMTKECIVH